MSLYHYYLFVYFPRFPFRVKVTRKSPFYPTKSPFSYYLVKTFVRTVKILWMLSDDQQLFSALSYHAYILRMAKVSAVAVVDSLSCFYFPFILREVCRCS